MTQGSPSKGCLTTKTATEDDPSERVQQRLRMLLDELQAVICSALSNRRARECLILDPEIAAQVIVTFTRGLAVMERVYRSPKRLRDTAKAFVASLITNKTSGRRAMRSQANSKRR